MCAIARKAEPPPPPPPAKKAKKKKGKAKKKANICDAAGLSKKQCKKATAFMTQYC